MALEIERRFLVRGEAWRREVCWRAHLQQGYLVAGADGLTVRVRWSEPAAAGAAQGWLTLKARPQASADCGPVEGMVREEFEYAIPPEDALALLRLAPRLVRKWRHGLTLPGGDWVVDVFEADNAPLVVAEVELEAADQSLVIPAWCALEVTGRHELSNSALAREPLASWGRERRRSLPPWLGDGTGPVASDTIGRVS